MQATAKQKQLIHVNAPTKDIKEEFVQWATEDVKKISTNDLTFDQANAIMEKLGLKPHKPQYLATFDKNNARHRYLLSLVITYGWWKKDPKYSGKLANLDKLNDWMKSDRCPVQKPLLKMNDDELSKVIGAFEIMTRKKFK